MQGAALLRRLPYLAAPWPRPHFPRGLTGGSARLHGASAPVHSCCPRAWALAPCRTGREAALPPLPRAAGVGPEAQPLGLRVPGQRMAAQAVAGLARNAAGEAGKGQVVVISGPTASGKTRLALLLAQHLGGEIVSADSIQVYRGLDVGSAKSPLEERMGVPHHLLDIRDPAQEYTAGDFFADARCAVHNILTRGKVPIVVGGTGLYLRWFLYGKPDTPASDPQVAQQVEAEIEEAISRAKRALSEALPQIAAEDPAAYSPTSGDHRTHAGDQGGCDIPVPEEVDEWTVALSALAEAGDPLTARQLARNDWYRLKRAFSILRASGQPRSEHPLPSAVATSSRVAKSTEASSSEASVDGAELDFDFRCFFLYVPREELYRRIDHRCEQMVQDGMLAEALMMLQAGILPDSTPATRGIGYRQALEFVMQWRELESAEGRHALFLEFLSGFQQASRNYAKRQTTWFRKEPLYTWLDASLPAEDQAAVVQASLQKNRRNSERAAECSRLKGCSDKEGKNLKRYRTVLRIFSENENVLAMLGWLESQPLTGKL